MQTLAGKLDWLKERKDFQKNPVARIATRLLQSQYMPHGEDLYPWVLREIKRGNIQLPSEWQEGGAWHKLIEMEMSAEKELARRNALVNDPEWGNNTPKEWLDDDKPIDWENIQTAPWNKLTDTLDAFNNLKDSRYEDVWDAMMSANGGQQLRVPGVVTPEGERGNWYPIKPDQFKDWEKVLEDRAKRRKGVDPMQMSAPEFYQKMYNEWLPEWEDQHRQDLGEVVHQFPDKWSIRRLQNAEEAYHEGEDMGHCIGSYGEEVNSGRTHIFSLRDPRNRPHATFEIRPDKHLQGSIPTSEFERVGIDNPTSRMVEHVGFLMRQIQGEGTPFSMHDIASPEWIRDMRPEHQNEPWGKLYNLAQNLLQKPPAAPTRGQLIQVQGKENSAPIPEYQDRIKNWFGSMSPEHWPTNLEETSYHPTYSDPPSQYPDAQRQWDEAWNNDPEDPDPHLARTEEHYPSPAHERITGEICHCPWGPQRDLWSWSDDAGSLGHEGLRDHQRHAGRPDAVDHPVTDDAALTDPRIGVGEPQLQRDREVPGETAGGTTRRLRRVDMLASLGDGANTLWTQPECSQVPVGSLDHRMAAEGTVPPEVGESSILVEEHDKPLHNRVILAESWDYEPPEDFLVPDFEPWSFGHDGKGLMNQDGEIITWRTNAMGEPHHDVISAEENFPYVVKLNIYPNGKMFIPSPDELHLFGISREDATNLLEQQKLPAGLVFDPRFTAKTAAQPQVMYHVAPAEYEQAIAQQGLQPNDPGYGEISPRGVYLFPDIDNAGFFADHMTERARDEGGYDEDPIHHIYEVNTQGLPLEPDPCVTDDDEFQQEYPSQPLQSHYTTQPIPPDRIRRIAAGPHPDPWQPGVWGKGNLYDDGSVEHWVTDEHDAPHHADVAGYLPQRRFDISPEGEVIPIVDGLDQRWADRDWVTVLSAHPAFKGGETKSEGYGHGHNLAATEYPDSCWQQGMCGTYACALMQANPQLRFGVAGTTQDEGWWPDHYFAHDDTHAYDSYGKHPLPYHGLKGQWDVMELDQNPDDWGVPDDEAGPEGVEPNLEAAHRHIQRTHRWSKTATCPTCGDPLQGEHGTFCPRCQWSEENVNLDRDPLSNPPDPTVDMHRGIQASVPNHRWTQKWYDAAYDAP